MKRCNALTPISALICETFARTMSTHRVLLGAAVCRTTSDLPISSPAAIGSGGARMKERGGSGPMNHTRDARSGSERGLLNQASILQACGCRWLLLAEYLNEARDDIRGNRQKIC